MCWRCSPYGRDLRDPEWQAREVARAILGAFENAKAPEEPRTDDTEDDHGN
jgi:hypothetical protein